MKIGPRTHMNRTNARGFVGRPSDVITSWERTIGGQRFEFCHIKWEGGRAGVTVKAWRAGAVAPLHEIFAKH